MNQVKLVISCVLVFVLSASRSLKGQMSSEELDALIKKAMQRFNVAGVAISIVKDGQIFYKKGFGERSVDTRLPVNEETNFEIGSNSKAFTTVALSILVEEGKLSWNDKVKDIIPAFKMYNDYVTENFTIEDLLTHRSGLGVGVGDLMIFPDGSNFTISDIVTSFQHFKPVSAFRTQFNYDNQLYLVAGEVIERVSRMSWVTFVQSRIMEPLQMKNSFGTQSRMKDRSNLATPHSTTSGIIRTLPIFGDMVNGAAGGILSNVNDMSAWLLVHLNKGKYGSNLDKQLFSKDSQREMWKIHTVEETSTNPRYNQHFNGYGLGWNLSDMRGNLIASHTGGLPGMLSLVTMIPDINLGIVILTNTEDGGAGLFSAVSQTIIDGYLGLKDFGWVDKYSTYFESLKATGDSVTKGIWQAVVAAKNSSIKKADFTGVYEDKWFGKVEIYLKENELWFKSRRSPKLHGIMQYYKGNTFAIKWTYQDLNADAFAIFSLDNKGKALSIKMKSISPNTDFSFDFQDLNFKRIVN